MKTILLFILIGLGGATACAQDKNNWLSAGIDVGLPVYVGVGDMKGTMAGVFVKKEWGLSKNLAGTASAGYSYFTGAIRSFNKEEINDFAVVPLLAGIKYYAWDKYYASFEAGVSIRAHQHAATKFTLVPAVGMLIPVADKQLDLGIRFYTIKMGSTFPEAPLLERGGYSLLGSRLAWIF